MSNKELVKSLRNLSTHILLTACDIEYYGGFNPKQLERCKALRGGAAMLDQWAEEMENQ